MKVAPFVQHDVLMFGLVVIVALFAIVIVGTVLGRRYRVGPPVLLIGLGALLGLIPQFGHVRLDGEIVLLLFLPAILYWESLNTSFREIRANMRVIVLLSVGLVIASAVAVSWTARAFGMESHAASVLGAVLSPTDAAAVAGLAKQLPRRTLTVLKAESIINDGTALVLFGVAVSVAMGGAPVGPIDLTVRFVVSYLGGIAAGLMIGGVVTLIRTRLDAPQEEAALSLLTPFAAFLLAYAFGCSGVVAVLVSALMLAYASPRVIRARSRLVTFAFWDIATLPDQRRAVGVRRRPDPQRDARESPGSTAAFTTPSRWRSPSPLSSSGPGWSGVKPPRGWSAPWTGARRSARVGSTGASAWCPAGPDSAGPCRLPRRWRSR